MKRSYELSDYDTQKQKLLYLIQNGVIERNIQAQRLNVSLPQISQLKAKIRKEGYAIPRG